MGTSNTSVYTDEYGTIYAKAKGAYSFESVEGKSNVKAFYNYMTQYWGYTRNAALAIIGNIYAESGLNPWRWQSDTVRSSTASSYPSIGYGLVQWTPAEKYVRNSVASRYNSFAPNYSNIDGDAKDYKAQLYFMERINNAQIGGYGPQYSINSAYNYPISWNQFKSGTYLLKYLTAAWLHNFERPADQSAAVENERYNYALAAAEIVSGEELPYTWPLPGYSRISTYFHDLDPSGQGHRGIDIPAPEETPIRACRGGTIIRSAFDDDPHGWGNYVEIDHGNGMKTLYAHMVRRAVYVGQEVAQGQIIGTVGDTGYSFGNHLHLEFNLNGTLVDPLLYINPEDEPPDPEPPGPVQPHFIAPIICELRRRKVLP